MSDGIKDMYDDSIKYKDNSRFQRLESLGIAKISVAIQELSYILDMLDIDSLRLSRSEWVKLNDMKKIIKSLGA